MDDFPSSKEGSERKFISIGRVHRKPQMEGAIYVQELLLHVSPTEHLIISLNLLYTGVSEE